MLLSDIDKVV